jgi:hypothetical protein
LPGENLSFFWPNQKDTGGLAPCHFIPRRDDVIMLIKLDNLDFHERNNKLYMMLAPMIMMDIKTSFCSQMIYNMRMDLNNIIIIAVIAIFAGLALGLVGLRYPPKVKIPLRQPNEPEKSILVPGKLPDCLKQYLTNNFGNPLPHPHSLIAWGRGRILTAPFPLLGPVWVPLTWTLDLEPGNRFVFNINLAWFGKFFIKGGDEYQDGHGRFSLGGKTIENENLDLSETTLLWIYSLWLTPFSLIGNEQVAWQTGDDNIIQADIAFGNNCIRGFQLQLAPGSYQLNWINTTRTTSRGGKELSFHASFKEHRSFDNHYNFPSQVSLNWEDEKAYLHLELIGLRYDVDVEESIQKGLD